MAKEVSGRRRPGNNATEVVHLAVGQEQILRGKGGGGLQVTR